jgi:hypothetical protein
MVDYFTTANKILKTFIKIKDTNDWEYATTINKSHLHKKLFPKICAFPAYRIQTIINKPIVDIYKKISNLCESDAREIDPNLISRIDIEKSPGYKIISQCNGCAWPVTARNIVFFQVAFNIDDKFYIVSRSVDHKKIPESDLYVRANLHMSVYELIPVDSEHTRINYIVHLDPCGHIPVWLTELYSTNFLKMFNSWKH